VAPKVSATLKRTVIESTWEEEILNYFNIPTRYFPGLTEETHEKPQNNWGLGRDLNGEPPEYKSEALSPEPACSVVISAQRTVLRLHYWTEKCIFLYHESQSHLNWGFAGIAPSV
jgi:hypothetical protein